MMAPDFRRVPVVALRLHLKWVSTNAVDLKVFA